MFAEAKPLDQANRCPLCHKDIAPGEDGWKLHLLQQGPCSVASLLAIASGAAAFRCADGFAAALRCVVCACAGCPLNPRTSKGKSVGGPGIDVAA